MFADTHCHPYLQKQKTQAQVLASFQSSGGKFLVSVGVDIDSSKKSIELADNHDFIYASVGIHPCDAKDFYENKKNWSDFEALLQNTKVVAIGETGLDYFHDDSPSTKEYQKRAFVQQIHLAKKYNLPIIIHNRNSKEDVLKVLKEENFKNFIFHCYSEDYNYAKQLIEFSQNCRLSFSGIVTFKNAKDIQEAAKNIPLKNILVETDSPYLTPEPKRGKEENEPGFTQYVLEKIISLRTEGSEEITKIIMENSYEIFSIPKKT